MSEDDLTMSRRELLRGLAALIAASTAPTAIAQSAIPQPQFATLSQTFTGFAYQDRALAAAILRALSSAIGAQTLTRIATIAIKTPAAELDAALASAGLQVPAQKIVVALYSGVVETAKGAIVLTYNEALAWQAVPWTKPNALCGGMTDYWASAPAQRK